MKRPLSRPRFARAAFNYLIAAALPLSLTGALSAQTLIHRYSFASDATDSVGGANGTIVAPGAGSAATITNGLILPGGGGGGFSGYVALPGGLLTATTNLTIECWATQNAANTWATIWDFANDGSHNFELCPHPGNNNGLMESAFTPHGNEQDLQSAVSYPNGSEQYVAETYNNATLTGTLYYNGAQVASLVLPDATYRPGSIGGAGGTTQNWLGNDTYGDAQFQGTIYEFRIWNGAVSQRYIAASAIVGPSVLINNLNPTAVSLTAGPGVLITGTEQATVTVQLPQTGTNLLVATGDATNWTSGNPNILTVNSNGLITGVGVGTTTVSAKVSGVSATSGSITVTPQVLQHRYSFVSDATDSVGGANGTIVAPTTGGAATITNGLILPGSGGGGVSGYVALPTGLLVGDTSITVECWVTQNQANTWATPWDFGNNGNQNFELIAHPGNNNGNMEAAFTPNGNERDVQTASQFPTGSEQYVTVTYNNSTLTGIIYTNGVLDASAVLPNITCSPGSIGGAGGTTENWLGNNVFGDPQFNGTIYEFRIWNGAVTPLYVAVSAAAGPSVVVTNLTPSLVTVSVTNTSLIGAQTEQATAAANFTAASGVAVTGAATNWTSSNPNVLTVSSSGLITALSGGSATVSATVGSVTATSASITVQLTMPTITQQPVPVTTVIGSSATFTVGALGGNLSYQWSEGVTPISGATNASFTLTNLALSQAGNYSVLVTNALGSTNSVAVALTVKTSILQHRYSFVSDASDSVGGANGTLIAGNNPATINNGLNLPGTGTSGNPSGYVALPNGIVQGDTSVTVECWVTQNQANTWAEIWSFGVNGGSVNFGLIPSSPTPNVRVAFTPNGGERDIIGAGPLPSGSQQYVVVTYNNTNLTANLYLNGALYASTVLPDTTYSPGNYGSTSLDTFGLDPFGGDAQFNGTLSELRIWNGVVSPLYIAVSTAAGPGVVASNLTPTSVTVTATNTTLEGGQTEQATAVGNFVGASGVTLTGAVTNWSSSNPSVLSVSSTGLITAVGGGSATISATVAGTTGTSASITVPIDLPTIVQEPEDSEVLLVGATLHASVSNLGVGPFTYKWFFNSSPTPISGATTSTLTIPNVQANNAGTYMVVIGNASGSTNSTSLTLTVVSPTTYQGDLLALHPLAYWPLSETSGSVAFDLAGGYNGAYVGGVTLGAPGVTNAGFGSPSFSSTFDGASGYVDIPEGPFNITNAISIAVWVNVNPANTPSFSDLIGHGDQSWRISINGSAGHPGANDGGPPADANSPSSIIDGNWHLVVYTYDGTLSGNNGALYVDGKLVANNAIATVPAGDNLDVWIGGAPDYGTTFGTARLFAGSIADAAVFTHALSAAQVGGLYAGRANLGITLSGSKVVITWPSGVLQTAPSVTGPWTSNPGAVSPFTNSAASGSQFFRVQTGP